MIKLDPDFFIYGPPFSVFGGVELEHTRYEPNELASEVQKILSRMSKCLYQAYDVKSRISLTGSLVAYQASPTSASIDKKCADYCSNRIVDRMLRIAMSNNAITAWVASDKGFHLIHILQEKFNPKVVEVLLKRTEEKIFKLLEHGYSTTSSIEDNTLKVDTKVLQRIQPTYIA